ncbi:MAG: zinc ABC transporter substrate-binding protein [Bacteroidota bacterium]
MKYIYIIILGAAVACSSPSEQQDEQGKLNVVATTGMIYDAVLNIARDSVDVEALMGPGVDPHLYKATQGDLKKLTDADLILYNGLYLEGKMGEVFGKLQRIKPVMAVAEVLPKESLRDNPVYDDANDPHIWFDVSLWRQVVTNIRDILIKQDTDNTEYYKSNASEYITRLDSLHNWVTSELNAIPEDQRLLITAHDAFGYFGDAYDIEVMGLQGISTLSEFGLRDISELVKLIVDRKIKAVFIETSVSPKAIEAVVTGCKERGHEVIIGGNLYSDAMGEWGTFGGTYIGMVTENVNTITKALR